MKRKEDQRKVSKGLNGFSQQCSQGLKKRGKSILNHDLNRIIASQHLCYQLVDVLLSVSPISPSLEGMPLFGKASARGSKFEWPKEVVGLLEMGSNSVDLVEKILDIVDSKFAKRLSNNRVAWKRDSLFVDLSITPLEDKLPDGFSGRIAKGYIGLNFSEKVGWSFVDSDEGSIVDLSQSEQSQDSDDFRVELVNTSDPDDECDFWLSWHIDLSCKFCLSKMEFTFLRASISALTAFW